MMSTTNKIFVDSSIFVEALKGAKLKLYEKLFTDEDCTLFYNETVVSEYCFHTLAIQGGKSPLTLKETGKIKDVITESGEYLSVLEHCNFLSTNPSIVQLVPELMSRYNLLPNDAIILATCKIHNITQLASHDADYEMACKEEGIELLKESDF